MTSENSAAQANTPEVSVAQAATLGARPAQTPTTEDNLPQQTRRRRPRRATFISEVDRHLIDIGEAPSWEQKVSSTDLEQSSSDSGAHNTSNDQRLQENIPPHSHRRI